MVDGAAPCVELAVAIVSDCNECDTSCAVYITSDTCAYADLDEEPCCESGLDCWEECTTFDWTLVVYDGQPYVEDDCEVCEENTCAVEIASASGTGCTVDLDVFGCLTDTELAALEATYYVVLTMEDIVGNTVTDYGILSVDTSPGSTGTTLNNALLSGCSLSSESSNGIMGSCGYTADNINCN
jgi:hypothetical protein